MTDTVAQELRQLAAESEELARRSRVASIAHEPVRALADYLCLRARLIEVEYHATHRPDELRARLVSDVVPVTAVM